MNEREVAILAAKRLKLDGRGELPLMSMIPNALSNLARLVANDPQRRSWLMTDRLTISETITNADPYAYCDLSTILIPTNQIMLEYLNYGSIFYEYTATFSESDVDDGSDLINITNGSFFANEKVRVAPDPGDILPAPLSALVDYYIGFRSADDPSQIQLFTAPDDATTLVDLTTQGTGSFNMTLQGAQVCQWLTTPNIGDLTSAMPFPYTYIWLEQNLLYTNRTAGDFAFLVPFVPTLDNLPTYLEGDLIDQVVTLAMSSGYEPLKPAQV